MLNCKLFTTRYARPSFLILCSYFDNLSYVFPFDSLPRNTVTRYSSFALGLQNLYAHVHNMYGYQLLFSIFLRLGVGIK